MVMDGCFARQAIYNHELHNPRDRLPPVGNYLVIPATHCFPQHVWFA